MWEAEQAARQARLLAQPQATRVVQAGAAGVLLVATCPFCGGTHTHLVDTEAWDDRPVEAGCGWGLYRLAVPTFAPECG